MRSPLLILLTASVSAFSAGATWFAGSRLAEAAYDKFWNDWEDWGAGDEDDADVELWDTGEEVPEFVKNSPVPLEKWGSDWVEYDEVLDSSGVADVQYRVQDGDTLETFARRHGMTAQEVELHNDLTPRHQLKDGDWLYTVALHGDKFWCLKAGQTVSEVAQVVGQSVQAIAYWNGLEDPDRVTVGEVLWLAPVMNPLMEE